MSQAEPQIAQTAQAGAPARQVMETEGLRSMTRPDRLTRLFMAIIAFAERLNLKYAVHGNPCVYDNAEFPWVAAVERNWRAIRRELDAVLQRRAELPPIQDLTADVGSITKDAGWKVFVLTAYGMTAERNARLCPETWRSVRQIPGLKTAMFSVFEPGKRLPPHRGPYNGVLRFHLGLLVPEDERIGIRIGTEVRHWREGEGLVFDDAYEHEAWNESDQARVVLFVDFVKPLRFPANLVNATLLRLAAFTPFIREGNDNLQGWEREFHRAK